MWDHLSEVPALHLQLLFLGKEIQSVSEAMRFGFGVGVQKWV